MDTWCGVQRSLRWVVPATLLVLVGGCRQYVTVTDQGIDYASFGDSMFGAVCERVGYSHEAAVRAQDQTAPIDVSGEKYRNACLIPPPPGTLPQRTNAPKVDVLLANRSDLVTSLNLVVPPALLDPADAFLRAILPLYDDGTFAQANGALGALLRVLASDRDLTAALAKFWGRDGYRPLESALGLIRKVFDYPDIDNVLRSLLRSLDEGGAGHDAFDALCAALHLELATAQPVTTARDDPDRTVNLALGVLLHTDGQKHRFAGVAPQPRLLVKRDFRGLATLRPSGGSVPAPFVDYDGDGLADVDAAGRFVGQGGAALDGYWPFPTKDGGGNGPRDTQGRLLEASGQPVYDYLDLDDTLIAGAVRDGLQLFDPQKDTVLKLLRGAGVLLGPRQTVVRTYALSDGTSRTLSFSGFDAQQAPLLDLVYAVIQLLGAPAIDAALDASARLLDGHEDIVAWLAGSALGIKEFAKRPEFAGAAFPETSTVFDDLIVVLRRLLANQALTMDLMDALSDPITQNLGRIHSYYMTYRDRWDPQPAPNDINLPPVGGFAQKVDRNAPDSGLNRSVNHRLFHLIHDTNGARLCSKAGATVQVWGIGLATYANQCELFQIDSLAKFYIESIARVWDDDVGEYVPKARFPLNLKGLLTVAPRSLMDSTLQSESGITGFKTRPTTESLNRAIFANPTPAFIANLQDDPTCVDGDKLKDAHAGTIIAWEARARDFAFTPYGLYNADESLFYQSLRPVVNAFAKHNEESLFLDIISVLYHHWPTSQSAECQFTSPMAPRFCFGDGGATYEPLVAAILDPLNVSVYPTAPPNTFELMRALTGSAPVLANLTLTNGSPARPELVNTAAWLLQPQNGLTYRDGTAQVSFRRLVPTAGKDQLTEGTEKVSGYELLADALAAKRQTLAGAGQLGEDWQTSSSDLVDVFLAVDPSGQRFANQRLPATAQVLIPFLRERLARHRSDLATWLRQDLPTDVEDGLMNPVFAALHDLSVALRTDEEARSALYGLARYLFDEVQHRDAFEVALTVVADVVQLLMDDLSLTPILRAAGRALDPELGTVSRTVSFLSRARAQDTSGLLTKLLRNLWQVYATGETPFGTVADVVGEVHRTEPGKGGPLSAADYGELLRQSAEFVDDNERGLQRLIEVVANRKIQH